MFYSRKRYFIFLFLAGGLFFLTGCGKPQSHTPKKINTKKAVENKVKTVFWNFDTVPLANLPAGWRVQATNLKGIVSVWQVIRDESAPSGNQVLAMINPNHASGNTFNICWTDSVSFRDGEIRVRFKAVKGAEDQGGGVMWRVRDKDNYYIARFNPLENNFRLYYVRGGQRKTLAGTRVVLPAGQWYSMRIVQHGNHFEGYLNGKKFLDGADSTFSGAGGVGLWTKADAVTSFDDLTVKSFR